MSRIDRKPRTAAQASYYSRTEIDILSVFRDNVGCPRKSRTVPPVITRRLPIAPAFIQRNRCVGIRGFPQIASRAATYRPNAFAFIFIVNKSHRDFYCHVDIRAIQKPLNLKAKSKRLKETTSSVADRSSHNVCDVRYRRHRDPDTAINFITIVTFAANKNPVDRRAPNPTTLTR